MTLSQSSEINLTDNGKQALKAQISASNAYNLANNAQDLANSAQKTADGKNSIYRGSDPNTIPTAGLKVGDLYFTDTALYTWNGSAWEETISDTTGAKIKAEVEQAVQESKKAVADLSSNIESKVKDLDASIESTKNDLTTTTNAVAKDLSETKSNLATVASDLSETKSNLKSSLDAVNSDLSTTKSNLNTVASDLSETKTSIKSSLDSINNDLSETKNNLNTVSSDLSETKKNLATVASDLSTTKSNLADTGNKLETVVSDFQKKTDQLSGSLETANSKIEFNSNAISEVKHTAEEISTTVSNLHAGDRNYVRGTSNNWKDLTNFNNTANVCLPLGTFYPGDLKGSDQITLGLTLKNVGITSGTMWLFQGYGDVSGWRFGGASDAYDIAKLVPAGQTAEIRIVKTLSASDVSNNTIQLRIRTDNVPAGGTLSVKCVYIKRGTLATDWSPAPEDTDQAISKVSQTADAIRADLTNMKGDVASVKATANSLASSMETAKGDISQLQETAKGLTSRVSSAEGNISQLQQTADGLSATVKGGRNQLNNTSDTLQTVTVNGWWWYTTSADEPIAKHQLDGQKVTLSAWIENPSKEAWVQLYTNKGILRGNSIPAGGKGWSQVTDTMPSGFSGWNIVVGCGDGSGTVTFSYSSLQLELGPNRTAWSQSTADISQLKITASSLTSDIANAKGDISQLQQTAKGLTSRVGDAEGNISQLQETAKGLQSTVSDHSGQISQLQQTADHIKFSMAGQGIDLVDGLDGQLIMGYGIPNTTWDGTNSSLTLPTTPRTSPPTPNEVLPINGTAFSLYYSWEAGKTYTQSIIIETDAQINTSVQPQWTWFTIAGGHNAQPAELINLGNNCYRLIGSYTPDSNNAKDSLRIIDILNFTSFVNVTTGTYLKFRSPHFFCADDNSLSELKITANSLKSDISDAKGDISQLQQDAKGLATRVGDAEGNISQLQETAKGLTSTISSMNIGGRNLLDGETEKEYSATGTTSDQDAVNFRMLVPADQEHYVLSFDAKATTAGQQISTFLFCQDDYSKNCTVSAITSSGYNGSVRADGRVTTALTTDYKRYWIKYTINPENKVYLNAIIARIEANSGTATVSVKNAKLETGTIPTDWTPSPESIDSSISQIKQTADKIQAQVEDSKGDISRLQETAGKITATLSSGGVNLLHGTSDFSCDLNKWSSDNYQTVNQTDQYNDTEHVTERKIVMTPGVNQGFWWSGNNTVGQTYTLSFDVRSDNGKASIWLAGFEDNFLGSSSALATDWTRYHYTVDVTQANHNWIIYFQTSEADNVYIRKLQLEYGDTPTPWRPSSGDVSQLQQTAKGLTLRIGDAEGNISQLQHTASELNSTIGKMPDQWQQAINDKVSAQVLDSNVDMNNLTTAGTYLIKDFGVKNAPFSAWFMATVEATADGSRVVQRVKKDDSNVAYERSNTDSGWTAWERIATGSDVSSIQQTIQGITTRVENAEGNISTIRETANNITAYVKESKGSHILSSILSTDPNNSTIAQVVDGKPIAAINLSSEGNALISGKKIMLDGDVTIDGHAFASKLKATGISVDELVAGVIDASKIQVINLDANSITTGSFSAVLSKEMNFKTYTVSSSSVWDFDYTKSNYGNWFLVGETTADHVYNGPKDINNNKLTPNMYVTSRGTGNNFTVTVWKDYDPTQYQRIWSYDHWTDWVMLPNTHNLVSAINLSPDGVMISGKHIELNGDTTIHGQLNLLPTDQREVNQNVQGFHNPWHWRDATVYAGGGGLQLQSTVVSQKYDDDNTNVSGLTGSSAAITTLAPTYLKFTLYPSWNDVANNFSNQLCRTYIDAGRIETNDVRAGNFRLMGSKMRGLNGSLYVTNWNGTNFDNAGAAGFQVWNGIGLGQNTIYTQSRDLYVQQGNVGPAFGQSYSSANKTSIHCQNVISQTANTVSSRLSVKTAITKVDYDRALMAIQNTDMYDYRYISDESNQHYVSGIIDDIHDKPEYNMDPMLINKERTARIDANLLGYHHVVLQEMLKENKEMSEKLTELEKKLDELEAK